MTLNIDSSIDQCDRRHGRVDTPQLILCLSINIDRYELIESVTCPIAKSVFFILMGQ